MVVDVDVDRGELLERVGFAALWVICRNLSVARSRRRKGKCAFSQRLFAQRPISCLAVFPRAFIAALNEVSPSVVIAWGEPGRLMPSS